MKVVIIGGRGTAIVIADQMFDAHKRFGMDIEVLGLALDDRSGGDSISGYPILCDIRDAYARYGQYEDVKFVYSLYRSDVLKERTQLLYSLNIPEEKFCNFIHPSAMVAKSVRMGYGNILMANVVVNSNTVLGNFNTVNSGALLGHDTIIGNNNFFAGQVCVGSVIKLGNVNFVGLNAAIRGNLEIGDNNLIGMSSCVVKNIGNDTIAYGNPAVNRPRN